MDTFLVQVQYLISLKPREIYDGWDDIIAEASSCANVALQDKKPDAKTVNWVMEMLAISRKKATELEYALRPKKEVLEVFEQMQKWLSLGIATRAILK